MNSQKTCVLIGIALGQLACGDPDSLGSETPAAMTGGDPTGMSSGGAAGAGENAGSGELDGGGSAGFGENGGAAGSGASGSFTFGAPEVLVDGLAWPTRLVLDGEYVYYTTTNGPTFNDGLGGVWRIPATGGDVEALASGQDQPAGIHVSNGVVYWSNIYGSSIDLWNNANGSELRRLTLPSGTPETLLHLDPNGLLLLGGAGQRLYVSSLTDGELIVFDLSSATYRLAASMTTVPPRQLSVHYIAVTPSEVFFSDLGFPEEGIGGIFVMSLDGSEVRTWEPLSGLAAPKGIAVRGAMLYFATVGIFSFGANAPTLSGGVYRMALAGTTPESILWPRAEELFSSDNEPFALAVDDRFIYFTERGQHSHGNPIACDTPSGRLLALPLEGGSPIVLADNLVCPSTIVVSDAAVHWVNNGESQATTGSLMRVPKLANP